jgi:phosphopantetheinyl transferase (holo-ACP synthase)
MVLGTGIDIIEVERVKTIAERNSRFLEKIFTSREITSGCSFCCQGGFLQGFWKEDKLDCGRAL